MCLEFTETVDTEETEFETVDEDTNLSTVYDDLSARLREVQAIAAKNKINYLGVIDRGEELGASMYVTKDSGFQLQVAAAAISGDTERALHILLGQSLGAMLSAGDNSDEDEE